MTSPFAPKPLFATLAPLGLALGAGAFAAALTPSLIPRAGMLQGALAGLAFALVYGLGAAAAATWLWLGLPPVRSRWLDRAAVAAGLAVLGFGLVRATDWQNLVHAAADLPPVETARPYVIAATGAATAAALILLGRLFRMLAIGAANLLARGLPARLSLTLGLIATATLFWLVGNGVLASGALRALDASYRLVDELIPPEAAPPDDPRASGGPGSLLSWERLGAAGRDRVAQWPSQADIEALIDGPALTPLRVYVGQAAAESPEARAALALEELIRIGGFDRRLLVIATPTGTGWIDPASMAPLEVLWGGDVASVSVQYSHLPSWLSLLAEPENGLDTARAVFRRVYAHWSALPHDARPRLYLHGLSLGARNSELSADLWDILDDPHHGAYWVGPPFDAALWTDFVRAREAGSPAHRPRVGDGSRVRFLTGGDADRREDYAPWGRTRIVYLHYASDPITFFEPEAAWRPPDWMREPPGDGVAPELRWAPVVTALQLLADLGAATTTPKGRGHVYAAADYLQGWIELTDPPGWDAARLDRLRATMAARGL